jgi:hypothetical protein
VIGVHFPKKIISSMRFSARSIQTRAAEAETFIWQKQADALFIAELIFQMHSGNGSRMSLGQKEDISEKLA